MQGMAQLLDQGFLTFGNLGKRFKRRAVFRRQNTEIKLFERGRHAAYYTAKSEG